jgi:hypothetical protein
LFTAQLDLNRVRQKPGGLRRTAFIYPLPTKHRAARAAPLSFGWSRLAPQRYKFNRFLKVYSTKKTLFAVSLCLV